ncbi:HNH endonuclease family protein [Fischerella thermalis]|uniref:HNH endonuclease family protein n=1 Tax=Fischerella thermalis TaxID=372787 RepID=UPI0021552E1F|nr:HNH endonuclease family protein [Fischerella thermalis]
MKKFPEFLRYYLSLKQTRVRRERLFKVVRESVKVDQQAFELLDQLENYSSLFIALGNSNDEFWRDAPENRPYIRELELFRVKQAYPALFAAYGKFSPKDFTRLLKLICILSFRYTVVSSLNPNELETLYNKVAIAIANGEITNPRQVFDNLRSVYVSDEKFLQDFALLSISTRGQKKKLARYILCKLEADVSGIEVNEDSFSIEHILPESLSSEWRQNFTDIQIEEMVYRVGNLTPLEPPLNRQVGNESYPIKREVYQQSVYKLTQDILAEEWTPDTLATRQRRLAQRATHIWRSDFPL